MHKMSQNTRERVDSAYEEYLLKIKMQDSWENRIDFYSAWIKNLSVLPDIYYMSEDLLIKYRCQMRLNKALRALENGTPLQ